jgi:hypothetical protein
VCFWSWSAWPAVLQHQAGGSCSYGRKISKYHEHIGLAFRTETVVFPPIAIRELIAKAPLHQDTTITGAGPLVELFKERLEITIPGEPLVSPDRFIDAPPPPAMKPRLRSATDANLRTTSHGDRQASAELSVIGRNGSSSLATHPS